MMLSQALILLMILMYVRIPHTRTHRHSHSHVLTHTHTHTAHTHTHTDTQGGRHFHIPEVLLLPRQLQRGEYLEAVVSFMPVRFSPHGKRYTRVRVRGPLGSYTVGAEDAAIISYLFVHSSLGVIEKIELRGYLAEGVCVRVCVCVCVCIVWIYLGECARVSVCRSVCARAYSYGCVGVWVGVGMVSFLQADVNEPAWVDIG